MLMTAALAVGLAFAGCGGSSTGSSTTSSAHSSSLPPAGETSPSGGEGSPALPSSTSTSATPTSPGGRSGAPSSGTLEVSVPGLLGPEHKLPKRFTCDGEDISFPVQWSGVPHGTQELALFVLNLRPVNKSLFFGWAVAGLSPTSHGISTGTLPAGAVAGRNSFGKVGYSICPPKGTYERYIVRLLALPHRLAAQSGFNPNTLYAEAERFTKIVAIDTALYERP
jgi:Raf kinase inhibitor-like YbhB/YbcL family protein